MRRVKLTPEERRIYADCVRDARVISGDGPRKLHMLAGINRLTQELFEERTIGHAIPQGVYGLTLREEVERQMRPCAICGRKATYDEVNDIDHDHISGALRDTLCGACNIGLGGFRDNPDTMLRAVKYLRKWAIKGRRGAKRA